MNVLHASTHFSLYTLTLTAELGPERNFAYLSEANFARELSEPAPQGVELFRRASLHRPAALVASIRAFRKRLFECAPDVLHVQEIATDQCFFFWHSSTCAKRVLTIHDVEPHLGQRYNWRSRRYLRAMRRQADAIIVHAQALKDRLIELGQARRDRVHVIPHPCLPVTGEDASRAEADFVVLFVGRMEAYKGLGSLLDALEVLERRGIKVRTIIAGDGPELGRHRKRLARLPRLTVIQKFLDPAEMDGLLRQASILVLPYLEASTSGVLSQAQSASLPVIASRVGGIPEYVIDGETGLLTLPGDGGALAEKIAFVTRTPEWLQTARAAIARQVETRFSPAVVARQTRRVYETIAQQL